MFNSSKNKRSYSVIVDCFGIKKNISNHDLNEEIQKNYKQSEPLEAQKYVINHNQSVEEMNNTVKLKELIDFFVIFDKAKDF